MKAFRGFEDSVTELITETDPAAIVEHAIFVRLVRRRLVGPSK